VQDEPDPARKPRLSQVPEDYKLGTLEELATAIGHLDYTAFVVAPARKTLEIDVRGANVRQLTREEAESLRRLLTDRGR